MPLDPLVRMLCMLIVFCMFHLKIRLDISMENLDLRVS